MKELAAGHTILAINPNYVAEFFHKQYMVMSVPPADILSAMSASAASDGEEPESRLLEVSADAGIITINGALTNTDSYWNRYYGLVSYQEITRAIIEAKEEFDVKALLFKYSSPGGSVAGMEGVAALISALDIPTVSFSDGGMMSAAYFLGSQADNVYSSKLSEVGSIGVYVKLFDMTKMLADYGVKAERFRSGPLKATGDPHFKLTEEERKYVQDKVDTLAQEFYSVVSEARGLPLEYILKSEIVSGASFLGSRALELGLIDKVQTFEETLAEVYALAAKNVDTNVFRRLP